MKAKICLSYFLILVLHTACATVPEVKKEEAPSKDESLDLDSFNSKGGADDANGGDDLFADKDKVDDAIAAEKKQNKVKKEAPKVAAAAPKKADKKPEKKPEAKEAPSNNAEDIPEEKSNHDNNATAHADKNNNAEKNTTNHSNDNMENTTTEAKTKATELNHNNAHANAVKPANADKPEVNPESAESTTVVEASTPEKNLQEFNKHFDGMVSGHPEGVYAVSVHNCPVYDTAVANEKNFVYYLKKGEEVHVQAFLDGGEWVQIGRKRFISKKHIISYNLQTARR